jgi:hypothetical protein
VSFLEYLNFIKIEASIKVIFIAVSIDKNQSKFPNTALLLVAIQIWIDFKAR